MLPPAYDVIFDALSSTINYGFCTEDFYYGGTLNGESSVNLSKGFVKYVTC